jgi:hypothetical protein
VTEISLNSPGIDTVVRQLKATGMPQHVRVKLHIEASDPTSTLYQRLEATLRECARNVEVGATPKMKSRPLARQKSIVSGVQ